MGGMRRLFTACFMINIGSFVVGRLLLANVTQALNKSARPSSIISISESSIIEGSRIRAQDLHLPFIGENLLVALNVSC